MCKLIAFYLPQFHPIKENDEWWWKGYTEWDNLKKAKKLGVNNYQPRIPLDNNYYNLLDIDVMKKQVDIAKEYSIDGFCFYHYWFNGHLLLEKPVENFLKHNDISMNYCFSWANHSWGSSPIPSKSKVFIKQEYGDVNDWISHYNYLLPFFKDERYIKISNKPMFVLHNAAGFERFDEMMKKWNELAINDGFNGIYFVNTLKSQLDEKYTIKYNFDAQVEFQPTYGINYGSKVNVFMYKAKRLFYRNYLKRPSKFSYKKIWKKIISTNHQCSNTFLGAYTDWDNTARWGKIGNYHVGANPKEFYKFFKKLYEKAQKNSSDFIFINAWNEWGEGAYLEPDEKYKYGYLEAIKRVVKK